MNILYCDFGAYYWSQHLLVVDLSDRQRDMFLPKLRNEKAQIIVE